jgi:hypothetical protein
MPELETEVVFTCAFTELGPTLKIRETKIDEKSNRTKIDATLRFLIIDSSPQELRNSFIESLS